MEIESFFAKDGPLAAAMPGYRPREGQIAMAKTVEESLNGGCHVLEAGTGIGKTFAYLAPIMQNNRTAIISTGTRALQDQLFLHDIPFLAKVLKRPIRATVLKGRGNYLCRRNMAAGNNVLIDDDGNWRELLKFSAETTDGDIRGAAGIPFNSPLWGVATSTRESCSVQSCDYYNECFLYRARAKAREADIVIVNHHLFLADVRLKEEGIAEILPDRDVLLFDEAHLLPQLASQYFGDSLSSIRLLRVAADAERAAANCTEGAAILQAARLLRATVGGLLEAANFSEQRINAEESLQNKDWQDAIRRLAMGLKGFSERLMVCVSDDESIANLAERAVADERFLSRWCGEEETPPTNDDESAAKTPTVRWLEKRDNSVVLNEAPLSGRDVFSRQWEKSRCVLFTSATLSVGDNFDDFNDETGIADAPEYSWPSPYDFDKRSLLYLPPNMPAPNSAEHTQAVVQKALPLIRANNGRAFVLFSSLRALALGCNELRAQLGAEYEVLKQGEAPNDELLRRFRIAKSAVLAGSQSFWQGVDVKGRALSLVVVDKIPFTPPDDPMLTARDAWCKKRGEDPFMRNQLPAAAILMKQVAGRLLRDFDDRGVFVICDPRIKTRGYGKVILNALPPMRRTVDGKEAANFLRAGN